MIEPWYGIIGGSIGLILAYLLLLAFHAWKDRGGGGFMGTGVEFMGARRTGKIGQLAVAIERSRKL